jgi:hypothetical protein
VFDLVEGEGGGVIWCRFLVLFLGVDGDEATFSVEETCSKGPDTGNYVCDESPPLTPSGCWLRWMHMTVSGTTEYRPEYANDFD